MPDQPVWIITGATSGFGRAIAEAALGAGAAVVAAVRRPDALGDLAERVSVVELDTTDLDAMPAVVDQVLAEHGAIDVLVNNAGIITVGPVDHATLEDYEESMAVHFWGPLHTMQAAIPHMRQQGGGRIANISSFGGKIGVPHLVPYCAGKAALAGLSGALTPELARDNIAVTTVCPGLMRTGSPFNAWFRGQHREEFAWFAIADSLPLLSTSGRRAAEQIVEAMRHGDAELVITWAAKLAVVAQALMPNTVALALQAANTLLPGPAPTSGGERWTGWQSMSDWAPSKLTRLAEQAALENNEMRR